MKLYYISPRDMRKNRADPVSIMMCCTEFVKNGFEVNLVTPFVFRPEYKVLKSEIWSLYGLTETFKIRELPTFLRDDTPVKIGLGQRFVVFGMYYLLLMLTGRLNRNTPIYAKCYIAVFPAILLRKLRLLRAPIFFDVAVYLPGRWSHKFILRNVDGIVLFNDYIKRKLEEGYGVDPSVIFKAPFPSQYDTITSTLAEKNEPDELVEQFRSKDNLVMYIGKMGPKLPEVKHILQAAKRMPEFEFALVGLRDEFWDHFHDYMKSEQIENATFYGFQPLERIYAFVSAASVLVSYYDSSDPLSVHQRVPGKSTVYIAAGKPIVFADLPSLREWFGEDMVYYTKPDSPKELERTLRSVFADPDVAARKAKKCMDFAHENTYATCLADISEYVKATSQERSVAS